MRLCRFVAGSRRGNRRHWHRSHRRRPFCFHARDYRRPVRYSVRRVSHTHAGVRWRRQDFTVVMLYSRAMHTSSWSHLFLLIPTDYWIGLSLLKHVELLFSDDLCNCNSICISFHSRVVCAMTFCPSVRLSHSWYVSNGFTVINIFPSHGIPINLVSAHKT